MDGQEPAPPERIALEEQVTAGGEPVGLVLLLADQDPDTEGKPTPLVDSADVLRSGRARGARRGRGLRRAGGG